MPDIRNRGDTSNTVRFTLKNRATGLPLTGLTSGFAGLIISTIADNESSPITYTVNGTTVETISTLGTFAAPSSGKCRFREVDPTYHPGLYEFQFADSRFAVANSKRLVISVSDGNSSVLSADYEIELMSPQNAPEVDLVLASGVPVGVASSIPANVIAVDGFSLDSHTTGLFPVDVAARKNTALANFEFVMFDTNGSPATGLTVTAQRSLDGGAFAACANSVSEVGSGVYKITLAAADLNADTVMLKFSAASNRTTFVFLTPQP